ncbi:hypothetical protein ACWDTG_16040 [Rhodococcus zopfii]
MSTLKGEPPVYVLRDRCHVMPGTASGGVTAWLISSAAGIALTVQKVSTTWAQLAPVVTVALAAGSYALLTPRAGVTDRRTAEPEPSPDEAQPA